MLITELNNKIDRVITSIPLLTALTFIYGYIGFHTFTTVYTIPIISTDISTVAGIGLFNLIYLGLLYISASKKRKPKTYEALAIYGLFMFVLSNPILIAGILVLQLVLISFSLEKSPRKMSFTEAKNRLKNYRKIDLLAEIIIGAIGLLIMLLIDADSYTLLIVIYVILLIFHRFKRYRVRPDLVSCSVLLLFPVITMYYFINSSKANILGLNKPQVYLVTKNDTVSTEIIFVDDDNYYIHNDSTKIVEIVRKDEVLKITSKSQAKVNEGLIDFVKRLYRIYTVSDTAVSVAPSFRIERKVSLSVSNILPDSVFVHNLFRNDSLLHRSRTITFSRFGKDTSFFGDRYQIRHYFLKYPVQNLHYFIIQNGQTKHSFAFNFTRLATRIRQRQRCESEIVTTRRRDLWKSDPTANKYIAAQTGAKKPHYRHRLDIEFYET
jgi:hypothetical protein